MKQLHNLNIRILLIGLLPALAILSVLFTFNTTNAGTPDPASGHTFSIVAVDPESGAIGSAGASCIDGSSRISSIVIGRGAIHAQALLDPRNRDNATQRMLLGESPQEIIEWLIRNDIRNDPEQRQYGIVDFDENGEPRSAGFTGTDTFPFQNHITGTTYAIQGNILSGQAILDNMEENFNTTTGSLAQRLMGSLQGANEAGADTRCLRFGTSSLSAFIRVACPNDTASNVHLNLDINSVARGVEPLDLLQEQFDAWLESVDNPVCADGPSTTPTINATATPRATLTHTPTVTRTPLPTLIPTVTGTARPTSTLVSTPTRTLIPIITLTATRTPLPTLTNISINTPTPTATPEPTGAIGQLGDSNCDSKVNAVDALSILRYGVRLSEGADSCVEGSEAISLEACDVSGNDKCNAVDALFIFQCEIGLRNLFCE